MERDEYLRTNAQELRAAGVSLRNSIVAVNLAWFIKSLDAAIFPEHFPVNFERRRAHDRRLAEYVTDTCYTLYLPDLASQFRESCDIIAEENHEAGQQIVPVPNLLGRIIAVAVHEVRHRLQGDQRQLIRWWHTDHREFGILGPILKRNRDVWLWKIMIAADEGNTAGVEYFQREFDSSVVEWYTLARMADLKSSQELVDIVRMQP